MSFLELAQQIDLAHANVDAAVEEVAKHERLVNEAMQNLKAAQKVLNDNMTERDTLYAEMQQKMAPKLTVKQEREDPSTADLKKLFLEGQKVRTPFK